MTDLEPDTSSPEYQAFIAERVKHCHCEIDQPCDGVMAGGPCDRQKEHRDTLEDRVDWSDDGN